jgi:hypothetical protein
VSEVSQYTAAVMDRLRSFCEIEHGDPITTNGINYRVVVPSKIETFKIMPHDRLMYLASGKSKVQKWTFLTTVKNKDQATNAIFRFLRGLNPD